MRLQQRLAAVLARAVVADVEAQAAEAVAVPLARLQALPQLSFRLFPAHRQQHREAVDAVQVQAVKVAEAVVAQVVVEVPAVAVVPLR